MRRYGIVKFCLFTALIAVAVHGIVWAVLSDRAVSGVREALLGGNGFVCRHDAVTTSGYPFTIGVTIAGPGCLWRDDGISVEWSSPESVTIAIASITSRATEVHVADRSQLLLASENREKAGPFQIVMERGVVRPGLENGNLRNFAATAAPFRIFSSGGQELFRAERVEIDAHAAPSPTARIEVRDPVFPDQFARWIGEHIRFIVAAADLTGTIPHTGTMQDRLVAWRDTGGTIEIENLHIETDTLVVQGDGSLAFDAEFRPVAAFSFRLDGYAEYFDNDFEPDTKILKSALRSILDLVSMPVEGSDAVIVDVSIRDGHVYIGPLVLADVDALL